MAERQKIALEMQLRQYQLALADQAESLAEAYARQQTAELQLQSIQSTVTKVEIPVENTQHLDTGGLRISTRKPTFGQKLRKWLGFSEAVGS